MKKDKEEISMILGMIPWKKFLQANMLLPRFADRKLDNLVKTIQARLMDIKEYWIENNHLRLGQVLINLGVAENDPILRDVDEFKWMCKIGEVEFA